MSRCEVFNETLQHGYMYKQSKRMGVFRKRYMVMDSRRLYSYKSDEIFKQNQQQYTESFDLNIYSKVQITVNKYYIKQFEFAILSDAGDSRRFQCNSEFDLRSWVHKINQVHQKIQLNYLTLHFAGIKPSHTSTTTTHLK
eukprot:477155_1